MENRISSSYFSKKTLFRFIGILMVLSIIIGFFPWYFRERSALALETEVVNGAFLYKETMVPMRNSLNVAASFPSGTKVAMGDTIAYADTLTLHGQKRIPVKATASGVVYYDTDGMESFLTKETIKNIDFSTALKDRNAFDRNKKNAVKIIDNKVPVALCLNVPKEAGETFRKGDMVSLKINEVFTQGKFEDFFYSQEKCYFVFSLEPQNLWYENRFVFGEIVGKG